MSHANCVKTFQNRYKERIIVTNRGTKMTTELISQLTDEEQQWWTSTIQDFRLKTIREPKHYAFSILRKKGITQLQLRNGMDTILSDTREEVWRLYLEDEAVFHTKVLEHLFKTREVPRKILFDLVESKLLHTDLKNKNAFVEKVAGVVGEYAGRTMPYIYQLSLSTTQSRRSRAGKNFEQIIESIMDIFSIPYANQSAVGSKFYSENGLGKKVDAVVPGVEEYVRNRAKCAVVTMKTSLRERWQEVAEELSRTNVPHIYLLTADRAVTKNVVDTIKNYNITLVIYKSEKESKFADKENVISFESFFTREMPYIVDYWKDA